MKARVLGGMVLLIFLSVTLFGLTSLLSHTDHHSHCPLQGAAAVLCESTTIEHIGMWQGMFIAVLFLVLFVIGTQLYSSRAEASLDTHSVRLRRMHADLPRPTLIQELFSAGILNRKEFYVCSL